MRRNRLHPRVASSSPSPPFDPFSHSLKQASFSISPPRVQMVRLLFAYDCSGNESNDWAAYPHCGHSTLSLVAVIASLIT